MTNRYWQPERECAPLPELIQCIEEKLAQTDVFLRAAASPLYRERWKAAGIDPASIHSYQDVQRLPLTSSTDLRAAQEKHHPNEFVVSDRPPRAWVSTSGSTGVPKWIPLTAKDFDFDLQIGYRFTFAPARPPQSDDVTFNVVAPAPFLTEMYHWLGNVDRLLAHGPRDIPDPETITFSFEAGEDGVAMAIKRKANRLIAFPSLAMRIADGLSESIPLIARKRWKEKRNFANLVAVLLTRLRTLRARDILKIRTGLFGGEPLAPYRQALFESWGMEDSYNIYTFSEYHVLMVECQAHDGVHAWIDVSLMEIIEQAELERERNEPGYTPRAKPLWEAAPGEEGELVITHFSDAFPLVRWRTSDLIQVVGVDRCACGRTHPRLSFTQRSDDLVNLGVIRFSIFSLKEKLDGVTEPARIARWQLRVGRDGYKPRLTVLVRPDAEVDRDRMARSVRDAVYNLEVLRMGVERGLVCQPVIRIDPELGESLSTSGKFRPLVYEKTNEGGKA